MHALRSTLPIVLLLLSIPVSAQQPTWPPSPPQTPDQASQALTLFQKSLAAQNGGISIRDVTLTGNVTVTRGQSTVSGTITLIALATGQSKAILNLSSGTQISFRDFSGTPHIGTSAGADGISRNADPQDLMGPHPAWFFPQFILGSSLSSSYLRADIGQETRAGAAVEHVAIWQDLGHSAAPPTSALQYFGQQDLYLDPATLLPVALTFNLHGTNAAKKVTQPKKFASFAPEEVRYSDYQQVRGLPIAFHIQVYIHNTLVTDIQLSSASVNNGAIVTAN